MAERARFNGDEEDTTSSSGDVTEAEIRSLEVVRLGKKLETAYSKLSDDLKFRLATKTDKH